MKYLFINCLLLLPSIIFPDYNLCYSESASYRPNFYSFDVVTDAQSIAMGESFVANVRNVSAFKSNPAALGGLEKINLFLNLPITIALNYSCIPLNSTYYDTDGKENLNTYNIQIGYDY